jgi:CRISPR associated protein Cas2
MNDIFVAYDLLQPNRNYEPLWDALIRLGGKRVLESTWEFQSPHTAQQIRDHLQQFIDSDDRLLVMNVSAWASRNLITQPATAFA